MQTRYLAASPYNLVRVILNEHRDYKKAAQYLDDWIREGILAQDAAPALYAYFQEFEVPDSGERLNRKGFIGLGKLEEYSAGVVYRHEQTLSGPKQDRLELLRHTRAHFGQLFMLYQDPKAAVDTLLEEAARAVPALHVLDEYGARHRLWPIADRVRIASIQELMAPKKLLIADGHHRYETALAYRNENPGVPAAEYVMMTFVNMHSPGLKILATHRVLRNIEGFDAEQFLRKVSSTWAVKPYEDGDRPAPASVRVGVVTAQGRYLLERPRKEGELDVPVLHGELLAGGLGISEEAVRDERHIKYVRGIDAAAAEVRERGAQVAFLLEPTPIEEMARIAFAGGVMPQKSTDFYPKLLSGVTIQRVA